MTLAIDKPVKVEIRSQPNNKDQADVTIRVKLHPPPVTATSAPNIYDASTVTVFPQLSKDKEEKLIRNASPYQACWAEAVLSSYRTLRPEKPSPKQKTPLPYSEFYQIISGNSLEYNNNVEASFMTQFAERYNETGDEIAKRLYGQMEFAAAMANPRKALPFDPVEKVGELFNRDGFALLPINIANSTRAHRIYAVCFPYKDQLLIITRDTNKVYLKGSTSPPHMLGAQIPGEDRKKKQENLINLVKENIWGAHEDIPGFYDSDSDDDEKNVIRNLKRQKESNHAPYLKSFDFFRNILSLREKPIECKESLKDFFENVKMCKPVYTTPQVTGNCAYVSVTQAFSIAAMLPSNPKIKGFTPQYVREEILGVKPEAVKRTKLNFAYKLVKKYRASVVKKCATYGPEPPPKPGSDSVRLLLNVRDSEVKPLIATKENLKQRLDSLLSDTADKFKKAQAKLDASLKPKQSNETPSASPDS